MSLLIKEHIMDGVPGLPETSQDVEVVALELDLPRPHPFGEGDGQ